MIRPATRRAPVLTSSERCPNAGQRRFKTFVRHVDKNNNVYYTLANRRPPPDPSFPAQHEFFSMPDLLLDLDAEGTTGVRPFDEEADERRLKDKWPAEPLKRAAVKARLKQFEEQVYESRRKARQLWSQPTNVWRITPHDLLSAALRGAPLASEPTQPDTPHTPPATGNDTRVLSKLRVENGIPPHALDQDERLLRWMLLRQRSLEHSKETRDEAAPTPSQLVETLRKQSSITEFRRLIFQCLAAGTSVGSFIDQGRTRPDLSMEIRRACERVLIEHPTPRAARLETLVAIGNLAARLSTLGTNVGAPLYGLCLKLSAEAGLPEAISEWLHRGYEARIWDTDVESSNDVLSSLSAMNFCVANESQPNVDGIPRRQLLFQLLTGIDENDAISPESFRNLVVLYLQQGATEHATPAPAAYRSYISLLGNLGAVRTLWKEWRLSAPQARALAEAQNTKGDAVDVAFADAVRHASRVIAAGDGETSPDLGLDECARLDYHAIEMQDTKAWHAAPGGTPELAHAAPLLDMPLNECIKLLRQMQPPP
ncbi:cell division cycle 37 [Purpureocillium lavendulum]|uniref:Cell division cycle 37 n=1 Tax=Purpureocillium lavendulum TaxID=1247861 RepID=A0AB34G8E7_9HYPO|nr:cell division cycle 37 [Purpureocillium lavendulum]